MRETSTAADTDLERRLSKLERHIEKLERRLVKTDRDVAKSLSYVPWLIGLTGLRPEHTVLDVGCGSGRVTRDLAPFLGHRGAYHGIEVQRSFVDALSEQYARLDGFHFHHADLYNVTYNPTGKERSEAYRFPLEDASVDVAVLRSVFTHLLPEEIEHYLDELARVVKPGGRACASWFVLDDVSRPAVARPEGEPRHPLFKVRRGNHWVKSDANPAAAVAFEVSWVRDAYDEHGWDILEPMYLGRWSKLREGLRSQDIVVSQRR